MLNRNQIGILPQKVMMPSGISFCLSGISFALQELIVVLKINQCVNSQDGSDIFEAAETKGVVSEPTFPSGCEKFKEASCEPREITVHSLFDYGVLQRVPVDGIGAHLIARKNIQRVFICDATNENVDFQNLGIDRWLGTPHQFLDCSGLEVVTRATNMLDDTLFQ